MNCISCSAEVTGKFCSNCGQRTSVKRLSVREGWNDFWARVYGFDGMFPRTLRDISIRPGTASQKYINGSRVDYYGPVGYFFLMVTLMYIVASLLQIDLIDFLKSASDTGLQPEIKKGSGQEQFSQQMLKIMSDNMKIMSFMIIPIQAFLSRYLFFRKSDLNYIEHAVLPFYVQGHVYWLSILSLFLFFITGHFLINWISIIIILCYFGFAYSTMFTYQNRVKVFFKGLGLYLTSYFIFTLIGIILMILLVIFNKDVFTMLRPSNNL